MCHHNSVYDNKHRKIYIVDGLMINYHNINSVDMDTEDSDSSDSESDETEIEPLYTNSPSAIPQIYLSSIYWKIDELLWEIKRFTMAQQSIIRSCVTILEDYNLLLLFGGQTATNNNIYFKNGNISILDKELYIFNSTNIS